MRLLIMEDEARIAEIVRTALLRDGFAIDVFGLCADAREALATTSYDAAILDLGLPDGDGLRLLKELRGNGNTLPVLVLTARDAVEHRVAGLDAGADDYLIKPFAMAELVARTKAPCCAGRAARWARRSRAATSSWTRSAAMSASTPKGSSSRGARPPSWST